MNPPRHVYGVSANLLKAGALVRHFMTPTEAARLDLAAFLVFATEIEKMTRKVKEAESQPEQMGLFEGVSR